MGIRVDAHHASEFERLPVPTPIEVEAPEIGVDLNCNAVLCACSQDFFYVYVVAWPAQELATRHVTKDRGAGVRYGCEDASGLFFSAELEPAVHARHNEIKGSNNIIWVVQRTICEDV